VPDDRLAMIHLEQDGPLAIVTLTNPPLNVLHPQMVAELAACFSVLATEADVVVAILTGQGDRAFCAGFDIKEFPRLMVPGEAEALARQLHQGFLSIDYLGKPTIASVNGLALGGGLELAMTCDLRIVAANAQLGQPEIKLGLFPGAGGTQRLPRLVGEGVAKEARLGPGAW
jgi:enoyl-CoA hydratase